MSKLTHNEFMKHLNKYRSVCHKEQDISNSSKTIYHSDELYRQCHLELRGIEDSLWKAIDVAQNSTKEEEVSNKPYIPSTTTRFWSMDL